MTLQSFDGAVSCSLNRFCPLWNLLSVDEHASLPQNVARLNTQILGWLVLLEVLVHGGKVFILKYAFFRHRLTEFCRLESFVIVLQFSITANQISLHPL